LVPCTTLFPLHALKNSEKKDNNHDVTEINQN
jgi:hypothetical protein